MFRKGRPPKRLSGSIDSTGQVVFGPSVSPAPNLANSSAVGSTNVLPILIHIGPQQNGCFCRCACLEMGYNYRNSGYFNGESESVDKLMDFWVLYIQTNPSEQW